MHYIQYDKPIDLLAFHQHHPALFPALLQSVGEKGWDILFALPKETKRFYSTDAAAFFQALSDIKVVGNSHAEWQFPFYGGWFFYAGYELLHTIESSVLLRDTPKDIPLAALIRVPAAILYDRQTQATWLVAEDRVYLEQLEKTLYPLSIQPYPLEVLALEEESPDVFLSGVEVCKKYILEGDVFQVNLSRAWDAILAEHNTAIDVYYQLSKMNPAPFSGCVDLGEIAIISSSPERLVKSQDGAIEMRPIAGTAARALSSEQDEQVKAQLIRSEKERAEHIMLVDLVRNDLGRICQPGTVKVEALMEVTTYTHVHHIESSVKGKLNEDVTVADIVRAVFPGGTITGCPKVRTMQIIRELERRPRLAYTGSIGYINYDGSLDMNILIRSFIKRANHLYLRTGAGIVADSIAENELQETRAKAKGLLKALGV